MGESMNPTTIQKELKTLWPNFFTATVGMNIVKHFQGLNTEEVLDILKVHAHNPDRGNYPPDISDVEKIIKKRDEDARLKIQKEENRRKYEETNPAGDKPPQDFFKLAAMYDQKRTEVVNFVRRTLGLDFKNDLDRKKIYAVIQFLVKHNYELPNANEAALEIARNA